MRRWLVLAMLAVGCGSGSGPADRTGGEADPLVGNWLLTVNASAGVGLTFRADGSYAFLALRIDTSANDTQVEIGKYQESPVVLEFAPAQSSCPGSHPAWRENYTLTPTALTLSDANSAQIFVPNTAPASSGALTYGCFASDGSGTFTPSPLAPVSN